jgi:co-chaperonin GroES (HSP10)
MKISPAVEKSVLLGSRILIQQRPPDQQSEGGIFIPDVAGRRLNQGTVVKVGKFCPIAELRLDELRPGCEVLYSPFAGIPAHIGGQEFLVLDLQDILLVL